MSKAELAERLSALQSSSADEGQEESRETELQAVLHELEVYQIELEMQVRELRESQEALEESHHRYVNLYDFAPVGYVTLTAQGTMREINLTAAEMIGVQRQWLSDRSLSPWIMGADLPLFRAHLKRCREDGGKVKSNLHLVNRSKQVISVELSTACFTDPATGEVLFRSAITDLTERRRAEEDLSRFFHLSSDLLCFIGKDGYFKRINPASETILGYSIQEMLDHSVLDFVHPDDREASAAELLRLSKEGATAVGFQNRYIRKDRSIIWLSWSVMTSGDLLYCVARDVSAQVRAKNEIEDQHQWLKELVRRIPMPLTLIEAKTGVLISMSTATESMFKRSPRATLDYPQSESFCVDSQGRRLPWDRWPRVRASEGEELKNESVIWHTPQGVQHLLVSSRNIPHKYHQPAMALIATQDVTLLKTTEESLRQAVRKLEDERYLREQFVSTLTHDLRTPLTAAKMSAELIFRSLSDPESIRKFSSLIIKHVGRIDRMIQDLLDASRIRAGEGMPLELSEFDLTQLVRETLNELTTIHGRRFTLDANSPVCGRWSRSALRRVIENLANNAIKYGAQDRPVTVSVAIGSENEAVLSVKNYGNPIPKKDQAALFEQFRRAPGADAGGQKGWGLGLTLVRGIVEAHGGKVTLESTALGGTTFRVTLPRGKLDPGKGR